MATLQFLNSAGNIHSHSIPYFISILKIQKMLFLKKQEKNNKNLPRMENSNQEKSILVWLHFLKSPNPSLSDRMKKQYYKKIIQLMITVSSLYEQYTDTEVWLMLWCLNCIQFLSVLIHFIKFQFIFLARTARKTFELCE